MSNAQNNTPKPNPTSKNGLTWKSRIRDASVFLGISMEDVTEGLKELGVEEKPAGMEMLSDEEIVPFGDLRKIFCDDMGIPIAKVRMAMKYLRGPKDSKKTDSINPEMIKMEEKYGVKLKLEYIPTDQLLEDYDPKQLHSPITIVLKERFGKEHVIVFKPDSTEVDIEATANYIADLEQGFSKEKTVMSQGELVKIYKVGEVPNEVVKEDPLFAGYPLKRERSVVNRVNWDGIPDEARQFVRIALEMKMIDANDRRDVKDIIGMSFEGIKELKEEFPEVYLEFKERKKLNNLPNLVMTMKEAENNKQNNPFGINRSY